MVLQDITHLCSETALTYVNEALKKVVSELRICILHAEKLLSLQRERAERRAKEEQAKREKREAEIHQTSLDLADITDVSSVENVVEVG